MEKIRFGPAGNSDAFYAAGNKHTYQMPAYLAATGLDAYEYQCGRGVALGGETAAKIKAEAEKYGIQMSLHSPYYISLSTDDENKIKKNILYIIQSAQAVKMLGGTRVVVHSGSCNGMSREEALKNSAMNLKRAQHELDSLGLDDINLCPETMGKINQLGTLDEVLYLCSIDERFIPCIDFGHLNARTLGEITSKESFEAILDEVCNKLGQERASKFHSHFSKIEYSKGGEVRHLTFEDTVFGPEFGPLAGVLAQRGYTPTIICESRGTQTEDAQYMMDTYYKVKDLI